MYYALVAIATVLFGIQFLFNKRFQELCGSGPEGAVVFSMGSNAVICVALLIANGFRIEFSPFSLLIACLVAVVNISYIFCSMKAFSQANLSEYSVFAMLGGMLLPSLFGIVFYNEGLTCGKLLCCLLISAALLLNTKRSPQNKGLYRYYLLVFILNGLIGVLSKLHQSFAGIHTSSGNFLMLSSFLAAVISLTIYLFLRNKAPRGSQNDKSSDNKLSDDLWFGKKAIACMAGYGATNGTANLLILISLIHLPASVQYPLITGGVMLVSALISLFSGQHLTKRNLAAVALSLAGTLLISL